MLLHSVVALSPEPAAPKGHGAYRHRGLEQAPSILAPAAKESIHGQVPQLPRWPGLLVAYVL